MGLPGAYSQYTRVKRGARGMSLVEVLLAVAILVAGLICVFAILGSGLQSQNRAIHESEAALVAASVSAEMRAEFFHGRMPPSESRNTFTPHPDSPGYQVNRQVMPLEPARKGIYTPASFP